MVLTTTKTLCDALCLLRSIIWKLKTIYSKLKESSLYTVNLQRICILLRWLNSAEVIEKSEVPNFRGSKINAFFFRIQNENFAISCLKIAIHIKFISQPYW